MVSALTAILCWRGRVNWILREGLGNCVRLHTRGGEGVDNPYFFAYENGWSLTASSKSTSVLLFILTTLCCVYNIVTLRNGSPDIEEVDSNVDVKLSLIPIVRGCFRVLQLHMMYVYVRRNQGAQK